MTHSGSAAASLKQLTDTLARDLVGQEEMIERLLIGLLAGGHVLIEGAPGLAKTRAVKHLAAGISGAFARIQCTPDLLPSDVTGTQVFRPQSGNFEFVPGPVFHNIILVDEINRAPPKVQSSLLEAMAERQVTIANAEHALPDPFYVIATQNPIEHEGTFPLPEAQLDRFLLKLRLSLPDAEVERRILDLIEAEGQAPAPTGPCLSLPDLQAARAQAMQTHLAGALRDYIVRLVMASRDGPVAARVEHGVSPRGSLALAAAAKARAWLDGRDHALPADVAALAPDVLAHRLSPTWDSLSEGITSRQIVDEMLAHVEPL